MKEQIKLRRLVGSHNRRRDNNKIAIKEYVQSYNSPRGRIGSLTPDNLSKHSQTMWLMDKNGKFIGRANYEGKTSAQNVSRYGYDETSVVRDTKRYKRVFGRLPSPKRRTL